MYSGDVDMCLPFTGTEAWTASLQLPVERPWQQWHLHGQVQEQWLNMGFRVLEIKS